MLIRKPGMRLMTAAACGIAAALALSPFYLWLFMIPAYSGLFWLLNVARGFRSAIALGWFFGFGYFLVGLHWVGNAFLVDAEKFAWLMPFAVFALSAGLAFIPALAVGATHYFSRPGIPRLFIFTVFFGLAEWLRGSILVGFPWLLSGHVWAASTGSLQSAAYLGASGLGLLAVFGSAAPALLVTTPPESRRRAMLTIIMGFVSISLVLFLSFERVPEGISHTHTDIRLRIVQAGIPQKNKWRPELRDSHLATYLRLSSNPNEQGQKFNFSHLIWPETATPFYLARDLARQDMITSNLPKGTVLISGTPRDSSTVKGQVRLHNSLVSLSSLTGVTTLYDKVHLVPFGEYLPFRPVLGALGLDKLVQGSVDFTPGESLGVIKLPNLPPFRPLICYEIIFPREILPKHSKFEPRWLLNLTNDAWFGDSYGPRQHLDIARIRAVELGLPIVRAANTGISAVIDPYGRILSQLPISSSGVIDSNLPMELPMTPYRRFGDYIFGSMIILLLFLSIPKFHET